MRNKNINLQICVFFIAQEKFKSKISHLKYKVPYIARAMYDSITEVQLIAAIPTWYLHM